jgi:hypothetical protein
MGGFTEKARTNVKLYLSFLFLQWTLIPRPIGLVIAR